MPNNEPTEKHQEASPVSRSGEKRVDFITALPNELAQHIFSFLSITERLNAGVLSRRWYQQANDFLWAKQSYQQHFPHRYALLETQTSQYITWEVDFVNDKIADDKQSESAIKQGKIHWLHCLRRAYREEYVGLSVRQISIFEAVKSAELSRLLALNYSLDDLAFSDFQNCELPQFKRYFAKSYNTSSYDVDSNQPRSLAHRTGTNDTLSVGKPINV